MLRLPEIPNPHPKPSWATELVTVCCLVKVPSNLKAALQLSLCEQLNISTLSKIIQAFKAQPLSYNASEARIVAPQASSFAPTTFTFLESKMTSARISIPSYLEAVDSYSPQWQNLTAVPNLISPVLLLQLTMSMYSDSYHLLVFCAMQILYPTFQFRKGSTNIEASFLKALWVRRDHR